MGLGHWWQILQFWVPFSHSGVSVSALPPNLLQCPFCWWKSHFQLKSWWEREEKHRAGAALPLGCCFHPTFLCWAGSRWVPGFALQPGSAEDFTALPLWALTCAAVPGQLPGPGKCSEKRNNFMYSALLTGPKKSRGDLSAARAQFLEMTQNPNGFYSRRIFKICSSVPGCAHSPQGAKINYSLFLQASVY